MKIHWERNHWIHFTWSLTMANSLKMCGHMRTLSVQALKWQLLGCVCAVTLRRLHLLDILLALFAWRGHSFHGMEEALICLRWLGSLYWLDLCLYGCGVRHGVSKCLTAQGQTFASSDFLQSSNEMTGLASTLVETHLPRFFPTVTWDLLEPWKL